MPEDCKQTCFFYGNDKKEKKVFEQPFKDCFCSNNIKFYGII